jgi:signal transduction histidine kinase
MMNPDDFALARPAEGGSRAESTAPRDGADAARGLVATMFSPLAHDIRAGLNGVTLWTHVLERGGPEAMDRGVEGIRRAVAQQSELAQQLSDLGRALSLHPGEPIRPVDVLALLREAAVAVEADAVERGVTLRVECGAQSVRLSGHDRPVRQLLQLLILDALAVAPRGGSVHATLAQRDDAVTLELAVVQPDGALLEEHDAAPRRTLRRALAALTAYLLHGELAVRSAGGGERVALRLPASLPAR